MFHLEKICKKLVLAVLALSWFTVNGSAGVGAGPTVTIYDNANNSYTLESFSQGDGGLRLTKKDSQGFFLWHHVFTGYGQLDSVDLHLFGGKVYLSGTYTGSIDIGGDWETYQTFYSSDQSKRVFVAKVDSVDGYMYWAAETEMNGGSDLSASNFSQIGNLFRVTFSTSAGNHTWNVYQGTMETTSKSEFYLIGSETLTIKINNMNVAGYENPPVSADGRHRNLGTISIEDSNNNLYTLAQFEPADLVTTGYKLSKWDATGEFLWHHAFTALGTISSLDMVLHNNSIYLVSAHDDLIEMGGDYDSFNDLYSPNGTRRACVSRILSDGYYCWSASAEVVNVPDINMAVMGFSTNGNLKLNLQLQGFNVAWTIPSVTNPPMAVLITMAGDIMINAYSDHGGRIDNPPSGQVCTDYRKQTGSGPYSPPWGEED